MSHLLRQTICCLLLLTGSLGANAFTISVIPDPGLLGSDFKMTGFEGLTGQVTGSEDLFKKIGIESVRLAHLSPDKSPTIYGQRGDVLDKGVDGNTLVSQSGGVAIAPPGDTFQIIAAESGFLFELAGLATQMSFRIVEKAFAGDFTTVFYLEGTQLGSLAVDGHGNTLYLNTDSPFDAFFITPGQQYPLDTWGIDDIGLGGRRKKKKKKGGPLPAPTPVPAPGTLWLAGLGLALLRSRGAARATAAVPERIQVIGPSDPVEPEVQAAASNPIPEGDLQ